MTPTEADNKIFIRATATGAWYKKGDIIEVFAEKAGRYYKPTPDQYIREDDCEIITESQASQSVQARDKGMRWVKTSERLPKEDGWYYTKSDYEPYFPRGGDFSRFSEGQFRNTYYNTITDKITEWLDETPTPESWWPTEIEISNKYIGIQMEDFKLSDFGVVVKLIKWLKEWLQTSAGTREAELREVLEEITSLNPYPESVFQPISNGELKAVEGMLKNINGMSLDRLSGHIGRLLLKGVQTRAKSLLSKSI